MRTWTLLRRCTGNSAYEVTGGKETVSPTASLSFDPGGRMNSILENRDAGEPSGFVEKAYQWTIDIPHELRLSLRNNVDGIITNKPDTLAEILKEEEFRSRMRLANATDNPWIRFGCHHNCESKPFISMGDL
ncbi:dermonecrotic toxin LlSicTox-alphaIV1i-like [Dermacentor variabilis]|uniref:dermonecrotic toxin LlSicTox-alphaIV1i-like n=1 Tax=Dermacentor variabilis TaxID=34621 RepID=UPI003F5BCF51